FEIPTSPTSWPRATSRRSGLAPACEVKWSGSPDFIGVRDILFCALWGAGFLAMLCSAFHPLGDSWKSAREAAGFAALLFYNRISRVSKWFFPLVISTQLKICA